MSQGSKEKKPQTVSNVSSQIQTEVSAEDTTISLTPSEDRLLLQQEDQYLDPENLRRHGWCSKEGTPWSIEKPKDEAEFLKAGFLTSNGERVLFRDPMTPTDYFDEFEKRNKSPAESTSNPKRSEKGDKQSPESQEKQAAQARKTEFMPSHYGVDTDNPTVENYVSDAEINTRGYLDRFGRVYYAIPVLPDPDPSSSTRTAPSGHVVVTSERSEKFIQNNPSDTSEALSAERMPSNAVVGTIEHIVGEGSDVGKLKYFIQRDGRAYNLQCADGNSITLTFNKKGGSLVTRSNPAAEKK